MDFFSVKMKGKMILSDTNDFPNPTTRPDFEEYEPFELNNGSVQPKQQGNLSEVHFDIDEYSGYVKGFIYEKDSKFLGKFHYRIDVGNAVQDLNGNYFIKDNILYISGVWYEGNLKWYFFMNMKGPENLQFIKLPSTDQPAEVIKLDESSKSIFTGVLNRDRFEQILGLSEKKKQALLKARFDTYSFLAEQKINNDNGIDYLKALHLAYIGEYNVPSFKHNVQAEITNMESDLGLIFKINNKADFDKNYKTIKKTLVKYFRISNNLFITTYSLNLIDPNIVPVYWKDIGRVWNNFFKDDIKKNPLLKLRINIPDKPNDQVDNFLHYWGMLLDWSDLSEVKSIKQFSDCLYWIV
jgi:hypothetical protein